MADVDREGLAAAKERLEQEGIAVSTAVCDVGDKAQVVGRARSGVCVCQLQHTAVQGVGAPIVAAAVRASSGVLPG